MSDLDQEIENLRLDLMYWDNQMDAYDDAGDFRAYGRAEMEYRAVESELNAKLAQKENKK